MEDKLTQIAESLKDIEKTIVNYSQETNINNKSKLTEHYLIQIRDVRFILREIQINLNKETKK